MIPSIMSSGLLGTSIGNLRLINPLICGSGEPVMTEEGIRSALNAGAAGVIAKSVNENPAAAQQLNRADYLRADSAGRAVAWNDAGAALFCRSGLLQREAGEWFRAVAAIDAEAAQNGCFVAGSVVLGSPDGAVSLAAIACRVGLRILELNVGAPHASEAQSGSISLETDPAGLQALIERVRAVTPGLSLWVKLTGLSTNLPALAQAARRGGADAVVMMGRFMGLFPDLDSLQPMLGSAGAYSGPWALPIVCRFLALSRRATAVDFPLLGTNGIRCGEDVARMALAGASAVEALSAVMLEGFGALSRILEELRDALTSRNMRYADLIGRAADSMQSYAEQPERPEYWQNFVPKDTLRVAPAKV